MSLKKHTDCIQQNKSIVVSHVHTTRKLRVWHVTDVLGAVCCSHEQGSADEYLVKLLEGSVCALLP